MTVTEDEKQGGVRAVERAIDILQSFSPERPTLTVPELQRSTGLTRPTLYRLLATLAGKGMVRAEGEPQRFSLDYAAARLSQVWLSRVDIVVSARPVIEGLRDATDETAALFVLRDGRQFCVLEAGSRQALSMSRGLGEMEHIAKGASGKAILAWMEESRALQMIPEEPLPCAAFLADLAAIRSDGHAISRAEVFLGAVSIAAPVFDRAGDVVGSIGLFGPEARMTARKLPAAIAQVVEAARALSAELGATTMARSPLAGRGCTA